MQFLLAEFFCEEHLLIDGDDLPNLILAKHKLEQMYDDLKCVVIDERQCGEAGFWEATMEKYFGDYHVLQFLTLPFEEDGHYCGIMPPLLNRLYKKRDCIVPDAQAFTLLKLEDACAEVSRCLSRRAL